MKLNRRKFMSGSAAVGALTFLPHVRVEAAIGENSYATLIDLTKCDGCAGKAQPLCIVACRQGREKDFPEPSADQLRDYWPQKMHEDWSDKRTISDRFTPYNWIFVQRVEIDGRTVSVPRRCMHCDNPPCAKLCPFGVKHKTAEGPVYIDQNLCFGGAKCRSVCPWSVPQRQAGVGLYTLWQKFLPVGGGVMYKCDLCRDRLAAQEKPFCIGACPTQAMKIGTRSQIFKEAEQLKERYQGDIYGLTENGGTSTLYVSDVDFARLDEALAAQHGTSGKVPRLHKAQNMLEKQKDWALLSIVSPALGLLAALGLSGKKMKGDN